MVTLDRSLNLYCGFTLLSKNNSNVKNQPLWERRGLFKRVTKIFFNGFVCRDEDMFYLRPQWCHVREAQWRLMSWKCWWGPVGVWWEVTSSLGWLLLARQSWSRTRRQTVLKACGCKPHTSRCDALESPRILYWRHTRNSIHINEIPQMATELNG